MRVLIIASKSGSWPYIGELTEELTKKGDEVDLLDMDSWRLISKSRIRKIVVSALISFFYDRNHFLKNLVAAVSRPILGYSSANFHNIVMTNHHLDAYETFARRIVVTIWGSELLRASCKEKEINRSLYTRANLITFNSVETQAAFHQYFGFDHRKYFLLRWGLRSFERIRELFEKEGIEKAKVTLGLDNSKTIVCLGYNATQAQQHMYMLESLSKLDQTIKDKIQIVLPMTYGAPSDSYIKEVEIYLSQVNIDHKIFKEFMGIQDLARLRLSADITINVQLTDSFSASIQEHLLAGTLLMSGSWLPYKDLVRLGGDVVFIDRIDQIANELRDNLRRVLKKGRSLNVEIYSHASWESKLPEWRGVLG